MFRKAQMKLFGIITAVLLALFIAVLGSVNIIMQMVMERQSRTVLKQIAAGVEYDDAISDFNYLPPDKFDGNKPSEGIVPPSKTESEPVSDAAQPSTDETSIEEISSAPEEPDPTSPPPTEAITDPVISEPRTEAAPTEVYTEVPAPVTASPTEPPVTTEAPTATPSEPKSSSEKEDTSKSDENKEQTPQYPQFPQNPQYPQWGGGWNQGDWNNGGWNQGGWNNGGWNQGGWGQQYDPWNAYGWNQDNNNNNNNNNNWNNNDKNKNNNNNNDQQWPWYWMQPAPQFNFDYESLFPCNPIEDSGDPASDVTSEAPRQEKSSEPEEIGDEPTAENTEEADLIGLSFHDDGGIVPLANISGNQKKSAAVARSQRRAGAEQVPKTLGSIDFFIVMADSSGNFLASRNNEELSDDAAQKYINKILDSGTDTGTLNNYQFYRQEKDNGTLLVFTDKSAELDMLSKLFRTTLTIGLLSFLALTVAAYFLSRQIIKPLKTAFEKQKQFVSDASHELKTPVTVISANADVLSGEIGSNKWLTYIKSQTERMNVLVNDLLNLTRLENNTSTDFIVSEFDLSKAITNTALPFECQAFETNKNFVVQVEEGLSITGSEKHIKQMAAIFIDNALKYSKDNGTVKVTLEKLGDKKVLSVFNTGQGVREEDKDKIFERFFRSDESRNRATGGYGLGLAIAKSIIDKHKFKVHVENNEGSSICFVVTM